MAQGHESLEGSRDDGEDSFAPIDWLADGRDEPAIAWNSAPERLQSERAGTRQPASTGAAAPDRDQPLAGRRGEQNAA